MSAVGTKDRSTAFRHAYFTATMVGVYGYDLTETMTLGTAHEMDVAVPGHEWGTNNSVIDMRNNAVGATLAKQIVDKKGTTSSDGMAIVITILVEKDEYLGFSLNKSGE